MRFAALSTVAALIALALASSARAGFEVHPGLMVKSSYDDNIFLSSKHEEWDFVTNVIPSIGVRESNGVFVLDSSYSLANTYYSRHKTLDETEPANTQRTRTQLETTPVLGFSAKGFHSYEKVEVDERKPAGEGNELANKTILNSLGASPEWLVKLPGSFEFKALYDYRRDAYQSPLGDDSERHRYKLEFAKRLKSAGVSYGLWGGYGLAQNKLTPDYDYYEGRLFLRNEPQNRFSYSVDFGAKSVDSDGEDKTTSLSWAVLTQVPLGAKLTYKLGGDMDVDQGPRDGAAKILKGKTSLELQGPLSGELRYLYSRKDYLFLSGLDQTHAVGLSLGVTLYDDYKLSAGCDYEKADYQTLGRDVKTLSANARAEWNIEHLKAALGYRHTGRDSSLATDGYYGNVTYAEIGFVF